MSINQRINSLKGNNCNLVAFKKEPWLLYNNKNNKGDQVIGKSIYSQEKICFTKDNIDINEISVTKYDENVYVIWTQLVNETYQLYISSFKEKKAIKITNNYSSIINPRIICNSNGVPIIVYQTADKNGKFNIYLIKQKNNKWSNPKLISDISGNNWNPDITKCNDGKLAVVWDGYDSGSYEIYIKFIDKNLNLLSTKRLTNNNYFNANSSVINTKDGGVWVAWNQGNSAWGKDNEVYRSTRIPDRNYLHTRRKLKLLKVYPSQVYPVYPPIQDFLDEEIPGLLHERPVIKTGDDDKLYISFRYNKGELSGGHRNEKRWRAMLSSYDGKKWEEPIELDKSYGLSTGNIDFLPNFNNKIIAVACGEGEKKRTKDLKTKIDIYEIPSIKGNFKWEKPPISRDFYPIELHTDKDKRHFIRYNNKKYNLYSGDLHRHTELSFCRTSIDGSLEEAYRYGKDAANLDFIMTADHDHQEQASDMWAQTMKNAEKYYVPEFFTTFFGYEWIGGENRRHRNIVSTERIIQPPFIDLTGDNDAPGVTEFHRDIRDTWETLNKEKSITIPHHTASHMSLKWGKDPGEAYDKELEPLVEIFQASRGSSEYENCPTLCNSFYKTGEYEESYQCKEGFVDVALKQNYRMGFIASSDHMSTHRSFAFIYASKNTREALMKAMKSRRTYGATDNIICEFFIDNYFMGEEVDAKNLNSKVNLYIRFIGTDKIKKITLLRDSTSYKEWYPKEKETEIELLLNKSDLKDHYFYVRMQQEDSNLAWSSPIWIDV